MRNNKNITNTKNHKIVKRTENQRIKDAYNAWVKSGEPAIDVLNNTTLPQDPAKPFKCCYFGKDKILKQLPKYWFIREDKTVITFKNKRAILSVPHVVHVNDYMNRPCYSFAIKSENGKNGYSTKKISDYDLMTLVWHPENIYGNARKLLEESLIDNLGSREAIRNKVQGHHYDSKDNDNAVMFHDTPAHDFCGNAPRTDAELTEEERNKFISDFGQISKQEPNRMSLFIKGDGAEQGMLSAHKKSYINGKELFEVREVRDPQGNLLFYADFASLLLMSGYKIERVVENEILEPYLKRLEECQ